MANRGTDRLAEALSDLVEIIDKAGLLNLSNGVQLGATSWYCKASERLEYARAVLADAALAGLAPAEAPIGELLERIAMEPAARLSVEETERIVGSPAVRVTVPPAQCPAGFRRRVPVRCTLPDHHSGPHCWEPPRPTAYAVNFGHGTEILQVRSEPSETCGAPGCVNGWVHRHDADSTPCPECTRQGRRSCLQPGCLRLAEDDSSFCGDACAERYHTEPATEGLAPAPAPTTCLWCGSADHCDCQKRADCVKAGKVGHWQCGRKPCGCPRFLTCEHNAPEPAPDAIAEGERLILAALDHETEQMFLPPCAHCGGKDGTHTHVNCVGDSPLGSCDHANGFCVGMLRCTEPWLDITES